MHQPPAVTVSVRVSPLPCRVGSVCLLLGLMQTLLFLSRNPLNSWQPAALVAGLLVSGGFAWVFMRRSDVGDLHWSGDAWHWSAFPEPGDCSVHLHLNFQSLLLVSLHRPGASTVWLWLERGQTPLHWLALRRAVVYTAEKPSREEGDAMPPAVPQ